jgi:hypothetical protein
VPKVHAAESVSSRQEVRFEFDALTFSAFCRFVDLAVVHRARDAESARLCTGQADRLKTVEKIEK